MADIMRMRILVTSVSIKIQLNLQERSWDTVFKGQ